MGVMLWIQDAAAVAAAIQKQCPASAHNAIDLPPGIFVP